MARVMHLSPAFCLATRRYELGPFPNLQSSGVRRRSAKSFLKLSLGLSLGHRPSIILSESGSNGSHFGTKVGDGPHAPREDGLRAGKNQSLSREKCSATMLEIFPRRDSVL